MLILNLFLSNASIIHKANVTLSFQRQNTAEGRRNLGNITYRRPKNKWLDVIVYKGLLQKAI